MDRYVPPYQPINIQAQLGRGTPTGNIFIGQCIYCGKTEQLTDEHTIPFALWGKNVLQSASCNSCATETSRFELRVLRDGLGKLREELKAPTRKPGRRTGEKVFENESGHKIIAPNFVAPPYLLMPLFDYLPRGLTDKPKGKAHRTYSICISVIRDTQDPIVSGYWSKSTKVDPTSWARMLVKIAYGKYIRTIDQNFRSTPLSSFIVSNVGDSSRFLGGRNGEPILDSIFNVNFAAAKKDKGRFALISHIRLFTFKETPSYLVWLGDVGCADQIPTQLRVLDGWNKDSIWPKYPEP